MVQHIFCIFLNNEFLHKILKIKFSFLKKINIIQFLNVNDTFIFTYFWHILKKNQNLIILEHPFFLLTLNTFMNLILKYALPLISFLILSFSLFYHCELNKLLPQNISSSFRKITFIFLPSVESVAIIMQKKFQLRF